MMERTQPQVTESGPAKIEGDTGKGTAEAPGLDGVTGPGESQDWRDGVKESGELPEPERTDAMSLLDEDTAPGESGEGRAEARESAAETRGDSQTEEQGLSDSLLDDDGGGDGGVDLGKESLPEGSRQIADEANASGEVADLRDRQDPSDRE